MWSLRDCYWPSPSLCTSRLSIPDSTVRTMIDLSIPRHDDSLTVLLHRRDGVTKFSIDDNDYDDDDNNNNISNNDNKSAHLGRGPRRCESKSPLVTMARLKFTPKVPLLVDRSLNPTTCLIPGPIRPVMPNGIGIRSALFPQCTGQTDRPTDAQTDSCLLYPSDAADE